MRILQYAVAAALCAAASAGAQNSGAPIDWRPQWTPPPSLQPGYSDPYAGWGQPRRTGPGPRHPGERSLILKDIHPPSPLGERDRYAIGVGVLPVYEVIIIPGASPCPPPYTSSGCMPMR